MSDKVVTVAIVGNPNCGKTSLFNALTGARQKVGNWPGVTVDRKEGTFQYDGRQVRVIDLPGVYSLAVAGASSIDERIARDYILSQAADVIVNILDASNLERNFYLTTQLLEMGVPMILALNMMDAARSKGLVIDTQSFQDRLGLPVRGVVAPTGEGLDLLKAAMAASAVRQYKPKLSVEFGTALEAEIVQLAALLPQKSNSNPTYARWTAIKLLEDDTSVAEKFDDSIKQAVVAAQARISDATKEDTDILIADRRFSLAHDLVQSAVSRRGIASRSITDRIDSVVLNRVLGIPIFLAVMYLMFLFTIDVGSAFIDFFDILGGTLLVDGFGHVLKSVGSPDWLVTILAGGVGGGIQTVGTFIPIIGCLFLFLSVLEDSGYMARAAFVMDRFMRALGLPGKSFVPMMVGFGCTVPAVMSTRTLDNHRDRVLTAVMSHFMSCGARLPVYALFAAVFFPVGGQNIVFLLYLIGLFFAVATGLLLKNTILSGQSAPFLMELPLYHRPTLRGVLIRTWERLKSFVVKAGKFIVMVAVVLTFLNSWGRDGSFGNENTQNSVLAAVGESLIPVFKPMGIREDNWPAAVGLFTGLFAKEVVVGTLDALYSQMGAEADGAPAKEEAFDLVAGVSEAFATIPANLATLTDRLLDPLGFDVTIAENLDQAAEKQDVKRGTFDVIASKFDGGIGAFAYLIAILLYSPCMSALSAYYRELSAGWTAFVALYSTALGYGFAVLTYQIGTFERDPKTATMWISIILGLIAVGVIALVVTGRRDRAVQLAAAE
ncbi:MAG: Fe(2+) transporter permease subunit FeoB [Alphaproteobacteria bacterium]|nr:Fe(2+) transporter permease subunit FeoB [Alphaproteobacteria bacterium]PHX99144.1 MAG: ferrous iron transporter B [Rhodospirillaceae bacterium]